MWFLDDIANKVTTALENARNEQRELLEWVLEGIADPLAQEIEWTPLVGWWASFGTHRLITNPQGNLEFQATAFAKMFALLFVVLGVVFDIVVFANLFDANNIGFELILPLFLSTAFTFGWLYMYRHFSRPIVFDKQLGYFYKGKPQMNLGLIDPTDKNIVPLSSIHALQIITERVQTKNASFLSHEINLILDDKRRINIVDHANLTQIHAESKQLAEYLGVPVWGV